MPGPLKIRGRSCCARMRYGEADRILHLYTPHRGRVGAIAKGVRRARSRFGGRLEPFFRLDLVLHEGRSDLLTVTARRDASRATRACASDGGALDARRARLRRGRAAVRRPPSRTRRLQPALQRARAARRRPGARRARQPARLPPQAAARRRLRAAAGRLRRLRRARAPQRLLGRRRRRGVRRPARRARSRWTRRRTRSWSTPSAGRWPRRRRADARALRQAERAIAETLEHHARRPLAPRPSPR